MAYTLSIRSPVFLSFSRSFLSPVTRRVSKMAADSYFIMSACEIQRGVYMKRIALMVLALVCTLAPATGWAEIKIGYIDSEVLKERLPEFREAQRK